MSAIKEVELPRLININEIMDILKQTFNQTSGYNVIHFKNHKIDVKVVKVNMGIPLFLVFGEHYVFRDCDDDDDDDYDCGGWEDVVHISDNLDDIAWFINGL